MCRFYSKLHRRWLSERKGAGLHRVLSLLVTLAWTGDPQEVVSHTSPACCNLSPHTSPACCNLSPHIISPLHLQALKTVSLLSQVGLGEPQEHTRLLWRGECSRGCRELPRTSLLQHDSCSGRELPQPQVVLCSPPLFLPAVFTLLLVLEEREESLEEVITKLHPLLISLAKPRPPESRDFQWGAVGVVLDGTAELLESGKGVSLGAGLLISKLSL